MEKVRSAFLLLITILCCSLADGQTKFEKGYFIDSSGQRTECLIQNLDWSYNPSFFTYKMDAAAPKLRKTTPEVQEFGIEHGARYVSAKVKMDRSSDDLDDNAMSTTSDPEWREEQVFLKVLTDGEATLYVYEEQNFVRYFFKTNASPIGQLVYKKYRHPGETTFRYNRNYLNQLFVEVNCLHTPLPYMENIEYTDHALVSWFLKQNRCSDPAHVPEVATKKRKLFSARLLAGIAFNSYSSGSSLLVAESNIDYGHAAAATFGGELEFIFPFSNNKWSCYLEPSTVHFSSSGKNSLGNTVPIDYSSVNVLLGFRYTSFLNENLRLCIIAGGAKDLKQLKLIPTVGAGIAYSRLMLEWRYFYEKGVLNGYIDQSQGASFTNMSLVVQFTLF